MKDNLAKWSTGGLRRSASGLPFTDLVPSARARADEREIAPHPSLKPQAFMRQIVWASLPLGRGIVLDPFMGSGSTIAAARVLGLQSIGLERDKMYFRMAKRAIPLLASLCLEEVPISSNGKAKHAYAVPESDAC